MIVCMKRMTISLPDQVDAELRQRAGSNLSEYVTRAVRTRLLEDAMARMTAEGYTPLTEAMDTAAEDAESAV